MNDVLTSRLANCRAIGAARLPPTDLAAIDDAIGELQVLECQRDSLQAALLKVLDAREAEAKAWFSYENAKDNFSGSVRTEAKRHLAAMTDASNAEREARLLLATLKTPNV